MSESEKKTFKKIDVDQLRVQQEDSAANIDRAMKDLSEDIVKKKQFKL